MDWKLLFCNMKLNGMRLVYHQDTIVIVAYQVLYCIARCMIVTKEWCG